MPRKSEHRVTCCLRNKHCSVCCLLEAQAEKGIVTSIEVEPCMCVCVRVQTNFTFGFDVWAFRSCSGTSEESCPSSFQSFRN